MNPSIIKMHIYAYMLVMVVKPVSRPEATIKASLFSLIPR